MNILLSVLESRFMPLPEKVIKWAAAPKKDEYLFHVFYIDKV